MHVGKVLQPHLMYIILPNFKFTLTYIVKILMLENDTLLQLLNKLCTYVSGKPQSTTL